MKDTLIQETQVLEPEIPGLLEKVTWGTEGARYKLMDIEPTLRHLPNSSYITLKKDGRLIGLRLFIEKEAQWNADALQSFYHSFFAIDTAEKGKGYGKALAQATLHVLQQKQKARSLIYCHVEAENLRSLQISESLDYIRVGQFSAMSFSRFFPKPSARLRKLSPAERPEALRMLREQYANHAITDFPLSLQAENVFVIAEGQKILAGVQVEPQHWKILSLAGIGGAIAMHALPRLPLVRDLFNPPRFQFLKAGNLFFERDQPKAAFELLEAVLVHHRLKTMMMFWDKRSPVFKQFANAGPLGILNALTETPVCILARFKGFDEKAISDFRQRPKVISPLDI